MTQSAMRAATWFIAAALVGERGATDWDVDHDGDLDCDDVRAANRAAVLPHRIPDDARCSEGR